MKNILPNFGKENRNWLHSYIIIVLALMLILTAYSAVTITQVRKDAEENNRCFANYSHTAIEQSLKSLQDYAATLLYSNTAYKMHTYTRRTISSPKALQDAYDLVYDIRNFVMANGMLDDIYLYYPEFDQIIGQKGAYSTYAYFKTENVNMLPQSAEYQKWMQTLFATRHNGFYTNTEGGQNVIYFYHLAFYGSDSRECRIVVVKLSHVLLNQFIGNLVANSSYAFAGLVDENGAVYASAGDWKPFLAEDGLFSSNFSNNKYLTYEAKSSLWPLTFVAVQDFNSAYKIVRLTGSILMVGLLLALLVGVSLAYYYARRNKFAIEQIKSRFSNAPSSLQDGDFDYIGTEIDKLLSENKNAISAVEQQEKMINAFFLQELFKRESCTEKDVGQLCAMYQISLENPMFSLVLAYPNESAQAVDREKLQEFVDAVTDDNFIVYSMFFNEMGAFLCNYEARTKSPQGPVLEFAKQMRIWCGCNAEISAVLQSPSEICPAWKQLMQKISPVSVPEPSHAAVVREELNVLREFNDAIDQDDLTDAVALIPELNRILLANPNQNLSLCRKFTLLGKLYETYDSEPMRERIDALFSEAASEHWEQKLLALLQNVDQDVNRKVDMQQVAELARDMIRQEYSNPQLGLQMIAEHIGVSQSYLSRLFKGKYGMSVIQYLNYIRIEQAKLQMLARSDNLKVIAMNVGFSSDVNLIRVFKKFENMTPGSFRNRE